MKPYEQTVKPKKALGQHFLTDYSIAERIAQLVDFETVKNTLEIGPGTGVLTHYLLQLPDVNLKVVEIDTESVDYLNKHNILPNGNILSADFLQMDLNTIFKGQSFNIAGNFPYNISSQIFFQVLDYKDLVPQVVGMLQKEVAERLASGPGSKDYGILSVLLQAWYDIEYCFSVDETVFDPPPKVKSGVIKLKRNSVHNLGVDEALFKKVVKTVFNQRRKMLSNSIKPLLSGKNLPEHFPFLNKRPEQLSVNNFIEITHELDLLLSQ